MEATSLHENVVDFLLVDNPDSPSGFAPIVATGYKAGCIPINPPAEASAYGNVQALSVPWIIEKWQEWIYPECPVESVWVIENYPAPVRVEGLPS